MNTVQSHSRSKPAPAGKEKHYLLVGLTGGIGSGKSAAAAEFSRLGRRVLPADAIGREITSTDPAIGAEIRGAFGAAVFHEDGSLDRKGLARIVFEKKESIERLNGIIHPRVFRAIDETLARTPERELIPYTIVEAALIFESGMDDRLDYVIFVDAPEEMRISRIVGREGMSVTDVRARMQYQDPLKKNRASADFVLDNVGSLQDLSVRVMFIDTLLRAMSPAT